MRPQEALKRFNEYTIAYLPYWLKVEENHLSDKVDYGHIRLVDEDGTTISLTITVTSGDVRYREARKKFEEDYNRMLEDEIYGTSSDSETTT